MVDKIVSAYSRANEPQRAACELIRTANFEPSLISFFCTDDMDGCALSAALKKAHPTAVVIGCTTAGEFSNQRNGIGGTSALIVGTDKITSAKSVLFSAAQGVETGFQIALQELESKLGQKLSELDPAKYVGIILIDGSHGIEERVNELLGNAAPLLSFVGGSAGDNLKFRETKVFLDGNSTNFGAVFAVLEVAVPFSIVKTCSFVPSEKVMKVTKVDIATRTVLEFDGISAEIAYAKALEIEVHELNGSVFISHPVGIMVEGDPWIRSPQQLVHGGGIKFYCQILAGMEVHIMNSKNVIEDTKDALQLAREKLGTISGCLAFNCILRRLEMDARGISHEFITCFPFPVAGFHTYGESWLGHINQTLTALVFS